MCAPPKIAVFVFVLTIHLAILAFAFPRLDLPGPAQHTATSSPTPPISNEGNSASTDVNETDAQPSAGPQSGTSPVQLHRNGQQATDHPTENKLREPAVSHDLHQHSLAESTPRESRQPDATSEAESETEISIARPDRIAAVAPAQPEPSPPKSEDPVAVSSATTTTPDSAPKQVTLTKAEQPSVSTDATSIPKPTPAAVHRPTATTSTRAGSDRMSNLRPLKGTSR